jgi:hypothetical protein
MSTTELTVYGRVGDPLAFVREFGTEIALSKMFGCATEAQGKVLAMACICEGINPIELTRKYHIISNKLSMRADAMLAELRARGGKHKVIERTSDKASVEIAYDGQTYTETLTWEDAKNEPYVLAKEGGLKDNWATPRARRQMLWARVISEAVRTLAPEIVAGTYTPEETSDFVEEITATATTKVVDVEKLMEATAAKAEPTKTYVAVDAETIDVEATPVAEPTETGKSTTAQRKQLRTLFDAVGCTKDQIDKALEKRGVKATRHLTSEQAAELIATLTAKAGQTVENVAGESEQPANATVATTDGPVGQVLVDEIKALLKDNLPLMKRIKDHLVSGGLSKVSDLTHHQAIALKNSLQTDTIELFFQQSLVPFDSTPDNSPDG